MPKTIHEIKSFEGGLRNVASPRDLENTELHKLNSGVVAKTGTIRLMGQEVAHAITQENDIESSITAYFGLEVFRSDFPYIRGCFNGRQIGSTEYEKDNYEQINFIPKGFECKIAGAGANTPGGDATLRVTCNLKHKLTTLHIVNIKGLESSLYDTGSGGATVYPYSDTEFDFVSGVSYSVQTSVNWIIDPNIDISELEADDQLENPAPGSYRFLMLQNKNLFHLYQHTLKRFFNNVGSVSSIENSMIKPHYIYIDDAVRCLDTNFHNKNVYLGTYQRGYSPRWFGFIPKREYFITLAGGTSSGALTTTPGWKDELNNVYDADSILGHSIYTSDDDIFKVEYGDDDDDGFTSSSDSGYDITSEDKFPMKVWMSVSVNSTGDGNWMMADDSDHENLKFGIAYIYDDYPYNQESRLFKSTTNIAMSTKVDYASLCFELKCMKDKWPARVVGFSVYCWFMNSNLKDPRWLGECLFDYQKGWTGHDGIRVDWAGDYTDGTQDASRVVIAGDDRMKAVSPITYKFRNGYEHDLDSATFRYKTAAVVNGKLYVGNVMQVGGANHNLVHQDRMLVSPVSKYDILDPTSELTIATSDGDEIIALVEYGNKLLQFKRQKLYIIFTGDPSGEQVEAIHDYMGIRNPDAVTKFNGGVAWLNIHGVYVYDGEQIFNVLSTKIDTYFWRACLGPGKKASIGYMSDKKELIVYFEMNPYISPRVDSLYMDQDGDADTGGLSSRNANIMIYNFETDSWAFGSDLASNEVRTNMIDDFEDKLMFGIGEGIVNESHSVLSVVDATAPNIASGEMSFFSEGIWDNTMRHLHFYNADGGEWLYLGECDMQGDLLFDVGNDSTEGQQGVIYAELLSAKIREIISLDDGVDDTDFSQDIDGNALAASYNAEVNIVISEFGDEGPDDSIG